MIPVWPPTEPPSFDTRCRQRGRAWLTKNANAERPLDYWSEFLPALRDGFRSLCGYSAIYEPKGTVDHFVSWAESKADNPHLAYEWSNFRYVSGWLNSSKQNVAGLLDPFVVQGGWFEILLPSLQLVLTSTVPVEVRPVAEFTIIRLNLVDGPDVIRLRAHWYDQFLEGKASLRGLQDHAPLLASAVRSALRAKFPSPARLTVPLASKAIPSPNQPFTPKRAKALLEELAELGELEKVSRGWRFLA